MKKLVSRIAAFAAAILLAACGGSHNANTAQFRALNAVPDAEALTVTIDDSAKATGLALGSTSAYTEVNDGTHTTRVVSATSGTILLEKSVGYNDGGVYTMVMYGKRASMQTVLLSDTTTDASSGNFKVRVADFALDAGALDFYAVPSDINSSAPTLSGIGGGAVSDYVQLTAGTYNFVFTTSGTKEIVFQSAPQAVTTNMKLTFVAMPALGAKLVNAAILTGTSSTYMTNTLARVKAINAVADSTALTFKSDSSTLLIGVPFGGASSYVTTASGTHTLSAELSNVPGVAVVSSSQNLTSARDYTVAALGTTASPSLAVIADDNSVPSVGLTKIRFGNLMASASSVDALINFASRATGIAQGGVSDYYQVTGATNYTLTFATPGGVAVLASIDTGTLDAGGIYTAYIMGTSGAPVIKLVRDR